jgi:hypothetical protein
LIGGVSGVDVYPWPAVHIHGLKFSKKTLSLSLSTVEFYVNNTPPGEYTCGHGLIPDDSSNGVSLFSTYLDQVIIDYGNMYGTAAQAVCPFVFKNAKLLCLNLAYQVDSFLFVSLLRFQGVNSTSILFINSTIFEFDVENSYNFKLDEGLLHPLVFEKVKRIELSGTIQLIQTDLFKHFMLLDNLKLSIDSLGNFYHKIGIEWLNHLKINSTVLLTSITLPYSYPDRDFCIFSKFPANRSIFLTLDKTNVASFTYAWLWKNGNMYINNNLGCNLTNNWTIINDKVNSCKVIRNESNQKQNSNSYAYYTDWYQTRLIKMLFIEIVPFVLIPCACFIGLFLNWKIIQTINNNKKKD